jgi:hypothetical protein
VKITPSKLPVVLVVAFCGVTAFAQTAPVDVTRCELGKNPRDFDQKLIRVRGTLNVYFEDFSLSNKGCDSDQEIWLVFGGDVPGVVPSMVNDNVRKPGVDITVKGVPYGVEKDDDFRKLYALIAARSGDKPKFHVTATLVGRFLAGEPTVGTDGVTRFTGYGHLGCCALFVIQKVSDVESIPSANLNLRGTVIGIDGKPAQGITVLNDVMGGTPPQRQTTVTDESGAFSFTNSGQELRIEDPRFRPLAISVDPGGEPVRVLLEDAVKSDWILRTCANDIASTRVGFSVRFVLPKTMQSSLEDFDGHKSIFIFKQGDDDTSAHFFISVWKESGSVAPSSLGSKDFEEHWIKDDRGQIIGRESSGRGWREADFFERETASYGLQSRKERNEFDRILDSACISEK